MVNDEEWHKIGDELCAIFNICNCQRKIKSIIDNLYEIYIKIDNQYEVPLNFTGAEWLLIAILDKGSNAISHGVNIEYPILNKDNFIWEFVLRVKDNENLEDN